MIWNKSPFNLILGGGGVKGLAYVGVFEEAEARNIRWGSIVGVSAGAVAGSFLGAGYSSSHLRSVIDAFDMEKIDITNVEKKVPAVAKYMQFCKDNRYTGMEGIYRFLNLEFTDNISMEDLPDQERGTLADILKSIATLAKEGCLFDGDYLEEWVARVLAEKGIFTFADLRGGVPDRVNPRGYKVRMTAVDVNRARIVILPDDMIYYGIDPDRFSVAKAVRMSTCVPFVFKPVEIKKMEGSSWKVHYFVDGGMLDGFPFWGVDNSSSIPAVGFTLGGGIKKKPFSIDTSVDVLKALVSAVHDIGVPKDAYKTKYTVDIDASKVDFLDFHLDGEQKEYLYSAGKIAARKLFDKVDYDMAFTGL